MANRPIKKWRASNIEAAIWLNSKKDNNGNEIGYKTVSLSRSYKKKDENIWRNEVINLRRGDLGKIFAVLNKVQEELFLNTDKESEEESE